MVERVRVLEVDPGFRGVADDLERKVLVDVGRLERERSRGVERVLLVLQRRVGSVLVDGREVWQREEERVSYYSVRMEAT